jgi:hypothetical protein
MIKNYFLMILLLSCQSNANCFTDKEYSELIFKSLPNSNDDYYENYPYGIIHNMADCSKSDELSNLVCHDAKLKKIPIVIINSRNLCL